MTIDQLLDLVENREDLEGVGIDSSPGGAAVTIKHTPTGLTTRVPLHAVDGVNEDLMLAMLRGECDPIALVHMTRVVGYFSRVENWNASKLGELRDRHNGDYRVE